MMYPLAPLTMHEVGSISTNDPTDLQNCRTAAIVRFGNMHPEDGMDTNFFRFHEIYFRTQQGDKHFIFRDMMNFQRVKIEEAIEKMKKSNLIESNKTEILYPAGWAQGASSGSDVLFMVFKLKDSLNFVEATRQLL